jgi:hypothetical protein
MTNTSQGVATEGNAADDTLMIDQGSDPALTGSEEGFKFQTRLLKSVGAQDPQELSAAFHFLFQKQRGFHDRDKASHQAFRTDSGG